MTGILCLIMMTFIINSPVSLVRAIDSKPEMKVHYRNRRITDQNLTAFFSFGKPSVVSITDQWSRRPGDRDFTLRPCKLGRYLGRCLSETFGNRKTA